MALWDEMGSLVPALPQLTTAKSFGETVLRHDHLALTNMF